MKRPRSIEADMEYFRLREKYSQLKDVLTPQAIMAVWLLLGDEMWAQPRVAASVLAATKENENA